MRIDALTIKLYAPWVHTLKEKRTVVKSLLLRMRSKFNVSAAEIGEQDTLQTAVIGVAWIAGHSAMADSVAERVLSFVEQNTEADILSVRRETR